MKRAIIVATIVLLGGLFLFTKHSFVRNTSQADHSLQNQKIATQQSDIIYFKRFLNLRRIQFVLPDVARVDLIKTEDKHIWDSYFAGNNPPFQPSSIGSHSLTIEENPDLIYSLRGCENYSSAIPKPKQHKGYLVLCWDAHELDAVPHAYVYIPETGQIGRRNEWCYLPIKFKTWMNKMVRP